MIKKGVTRIVLCLSTVVIKIPNFTYSWKNFVRGILANIDERDTWKYSSLLTDGDKSYLLCPVLWCSCGGWILIMKKVDQLINEKTREHWDCDEHIKYFGGDDSVSNYGILNGTLVKSDYGQLD